MRLAIIIPTYNEALTIERIVVAVFEALPQVTVIVVDDSSPDRTSKIVTRLQKKYPRIILLTKKYQEGLGAAYIRGFAYALKQGFDLIAQMDADFSHQPEDLVRLIKAAENTDLIIGSRYVADGQITGWSTVRRVLSRLSNLYARIILGGRLRDWTGGFNIWQADLLKQIPFEQLRYRGYFFQIALKYWALKKSIGYRELPITFKDRVLGESKLNLRMFSEAFIGTLRLRLDTSKQIADTGIVNKEGTE